MQSFLLRPRGILPRDGGVSTRRTPTLSSVPPLVPHITAWLFRSALALGVISGISGCTQVQSETQTHVRVEAGPPVVRDIDITLRYPVEVEADESVSVTPVSISGFLRRVHVDVGDKVRAGQLIAMVDCREYSAQRTQAETSISKWEAQVEESRARYERMLEMGERVVAPAELDAALKEVRVSEAELADAQAKLSEAGQRQGYCSLTAPFSGYVTERFLDPGAMVSPGGPPIVNIVKTKEVRVVAFVVEDDAPKVKKGAEVRLVLHAYPETTFQAQVARLGRSLDPVTRTLRVEMDIPNTSDLLLPAMTGTASIVVGKREDALLVPSTAILNLESAAYAYVVRDEGEGARAKRVAVETGLDFGDWIEIREGLDPEDQIIIVGRELVDDGTPVEVVDAPGERAVPSFPGLHDAAPPQPETDVDTGREAAPERGDSGAAEVQSDGAEGQSGDSDAVEAASGSTDAKPPDETEPAGPKKADSKKPVSQKAGAKKDGAKKPAPKKPSSKESEPKASSSGKGDDTSEASARPSTSGNTGDPAKGAKKAPASSGDSKSTGQEP